MTRALPVPTIETALAALEAAAGRVTQSARAEQTAHADALPAIVSSKVAALDEVNGAYIKLREALVGTAFAGAPQKLAEDAPDPALRERARAALNAVAQARAENEISRRLIQSKLNFTRTMSSAIQAMQDETALAGAISPSSSPFKAPSAARAGRKIGSA